MGGHSVSRSNAEDSSPSQGQPQLGEIPDKLYFTIGEVSEFTGVKTHVLRYWENQFPSLANIQRRGNRRFYRREHLIAVRRIRELLREGMTVKGAVQAMQQPREAADRAASTFVRQELVEVRAVLEQISKSLAVRFER